MSTDVNPMALSRRKLLLLISIEQAMKVYQAVDTEGKNNLLEVREILCQSQTRARNRLRNNEGSSLRCVSSVGEETLYLLIVAENAEGVSLG